MDPSNTLAQRITALGPGFSRFEELDPIHTVSNVFRPQNPASPHFCVLVQKPVSSNHSPTLVQDVGEYFICLFVPSQNI